ncbi:MAG: hypothetical protein WKF75_19230 [Singulisphaera sp.]
MLTQARERFYPVDAYLIDLCLIDPPPPPVPWPMLAARSPVTLLASARAIEILAGRDPNASPRPRGDRRRVGRRGGRCL